MALLEKRITDYVSHHIDLFAGEQFSPEYVRLNPRAETPTLVHDGVTIRESSIICEYVDDIYEDPPLKPAAPADVAHMREWIRKSDDRLYEAVACLSFVSVFRQTFADMGEQAQESHFRRQTDLARVMRQRSCIEYGFESEYVVRSVANVLQLAEDLEAHLSSYGPWLLGEQFTLAEVAWSPFLERLEALEMLDVFLDRRPATSAWWTACRNRGSFSAAEVGPAPGREAEDFARCGRIVRRDLEALTERIRSSSIYELASRTSRDR